MTHLDIDTIFGQASGRELEAKNFYSGISKKCRDGSMRDFFAKLADEEMKHFELLEKFRHDPTMIMKIVAPGSDWKVAESQELPPLSVDMKPKDAITLAMKKEQQAVEFYRALAASSTDDVRDIFENLAAMELGHKHTLEEMFIDIGYPEVF